MLAFFGRNMNFNLIFVAVSSFCYRFFLLLPAILSGCRQKRDAIHHNSAVFHFISSEAVDVFVVVTSSISEKPAMLCIFYASVLCVRAFLLFITYPIRSDEKEKNSRDKEFTAHRR